MDVEAWEVFPGECIQLVDDEGDPVERQVTEREFSDDQASVWFEIDSSGAGVWFERNATVLLAEAS